MPNAKLRAIVPPPDEPVGVGDPTGWNRIEEELGLVLPDDYKEFIGTYGDGYLAGFIHIFNPFSDSPHLSLQTSVEKICKVYRDLKASEGDKQVPFCVYPEKSGLLPWGRNDVGNYMFWLTDGESKKWPVVLAEGRSNRYERFNLGMATFLAKALSRELDSKIWPDDFPEPEVPITFQSAKLKKKRKPKK